MKEGLTTPMYSQRTIFSRSPHAVLNAFLYAQRDVQAFPSYSQCASSRSMFCPGYPLDISLSLRAPEKYFLALKIDNSPLVSFFIDLIGIHRQLCLTHNLSTLIRATYTMSTTDWGKRPFPTMQTSTAYPWIPWNFSSTRRSSTTTNRSSGDKTPPCW